MRTLQLATAEAAVRLRQTGAPVASIFGLSAIEALDDSPRATRLADLIGFSFYSTIGIRQGRMVPYPLDAPVSPLGYGIWADGLGRVLDRLNQMLPRTPLLVAEYGIGTSKDNQRAAYLERGLELTSDDRPRHRRPRLLPLDRCGQLRVAARLRRPLRPHRPGPRHPAQRQGAPPRASCGRWRSLSTSLSERASANSRERGPAKARARGW